MQNINKMPEIISLPKEEWEGLYQAHWEKAYAWGIVEENAGSRELLACIETCPEEWSNRLMVTEFWVHERLRRQGIGHRLMAIAKEQAIIYEPFSHAGKAQISLPVPEVDRIF